MNMYYYVFIVVNEVADNYLFPTFFVACFGLKVIWS